MAQVIRILERLTRAFDQLDEQLHAGYYFYFLTSKAHFVSNSVFVYPVVLVIISFCVPTIFQYYEG